MNPARERARREHALAVLILPLVTLALIFAAVVALENAAPHTPPSPDLMIEGLPVPVLGGEPTRCLRSTAEDRAGEVRGQLIEGSRITAAQVQACPAAFEGLELLYVGEVVGHLLERGDGGWVQMNDDDYALRTGPLPMHQTFGGVNSSLAVWLPGELADELTGFGGPGRRGDVVAVAGTVVRTDPDDGGGLTFRATALDVLAPAVSFEQPLNVPQAIAAGLVSLLAMAMGVALRRSRLDRH